MTHPCMKPAAQAHKGRGVQLRSRSPRPILEVHDPSVSDNKPAAQAHTGDVTCSSEADHPRPFWKSKWQHELRVGPEQTHAHFGGDLGIHAQLRGFANGGILEWVPGPQQNLEWVWSRPTPICNRCGSNQI